MITREALWKFIEPTVKAEGLEIFDIELPSSSNRLLRIFLSRPKEGVLPVPAQEGEAPEKQAGVGLGQCARVSHQISRLEGFEELISDRTTLEVSSPGINRKLRLRGHFQDAVGEHILLKAYDSAKQMNRSLRGILERIEADILFVREDGQGSVQQFAYEDVVSARVDFLFQ